MSERAARSRRARSCRKRVAAARSAWARRTVGASVLALLLALAGGCAVRDPWQDARIESEVKARLVEETSANLTRLGVASRQGVVHLTGTVGSSDQKALAERLARSVTGVSGVVNTLEVRAAPPGAASR